jgi:molecular chaperone DnaJ
VRRGQGIPRVGSRGRGDQHIRWKVEIPTKLSAREKELLRELAAEAGEEAENAPSGKRGKGLFGRIKG